MQALCGGSPPSIHASRVAHESSDITDDQCVLSLAFKDGTIGIFFYTVCGDTTLPKESFEAHGDGKSLTMTDFMTSEFYAHGRKIRFKSGKCDKGFSQELAQFVEVIAHGGPPLNRFAEIYAVTRACLFAVEGLRFGAVYDV